MFKLISLNEHGDPIKHVGEQPAFYELIHNGHSVGYFIAVQAAKWAAEDLEELMEYSNEFQACIL